MVGSRSATSISARLGLFGVLLAGLEAVHGFQSLPSSSLAFPRLRSQRLGVTYMRDRSSINSFRVGQSVVVVKDVMTRGGNTAGLVGKVKGVWSKCEEDPICCCAENGMEEASIAVSFNLTWEQTGHFTNLDASDQQGDGVEFTSYFGEDEIVPLLGSK